MTMPLFAMNESDMMAAGTTDREEKKRRFRWEVKGKAKGKRLAQRKKSGNSPAHSLQLVRAISLLDSSVPQSTMSRLSTLLPRSSVLLLRSLASFVSRPFLPVFFGRELPSIPGGGAFLIHLAIASALSVVMG
jgi:hypothetical protein